MYGMVQNHKHRGLGRTGVISEYTCVIETLDRDDGTDLMGAQDLETVVCCDFTRFTLLSATSFGEGDAID